MIAAAGRLERGTPAASRHDPRLAHLDTILAGLDTPVSQIDVSFVAVGNELIGCAGLMAEVTAQFEELPRDLESREIVEATERLGAVIAHAREIASGFVAEQHDLDGLVARVDAAHTPMASLRKTIQMIGIVAINARVVAASIAGQADELDVFTTDIAELSKKAAGTIQSFFKAYEDLSNDLHRAAAERARFQGVQQNALENIASRLGANLDALTERRRRSAESSSETGRITRDIGARIGRTVMAMQVGDSTRQRIDHAVSALSDLRMLLLGRFPEGLDLPAPPETGDFALALAVVGELLDAALDDFDKGVVESEQSMMALSGDAQTLMAKSRELYEQKDHEGESALGGLNADLHEIAGMLGACETDRHKLDTAALAVGRMVARLLSHVEAVQQIEGAMRLVTLNAAVKCAQLGPRGKALDVIAMQLRELTGNTVTSAKTALNVLNDAAERAGSFTDRAADGEASGRISGLIADATAALDLFDAADRRLSAALKLLHSQECGCTNKLGDAVARFSGHEAISRSLAEMCAHVAGLGGEFAAPEDEGTEGGEAGARLLQRFRAYYSMESERRIHDRFVGAPPPDMPAANAAPAAGEDDLGLF